MNFIREWWPVIMFALLQAGSIGAWATRTKNLEQRIGELKEMIGDGEAGHQKLWEKQVALGERMVELAVRLESLSKDSQSGERRFDRIEARLSDLERRMAND